jgi:hypothetical protein
VRLSIVEMGVEDKMTPADLYAVRVVTANLLRDGTPATQTAAVRLA